MTNSACDPMIKRVVEAILFISEKPVAISNFKEVLDTATVADVRLALSELMQEYEQGHRGMIITEIAGGYQMLSSPQLAAYIRNFFKRHVKEKLSRPALETLAIIAYKQPVTRGDIELIRGVNSDGVVGLLLNKALIKSVGRKDIPGRPYLYGTTKLFLEYFGLKSLDDLPHLESFPGLMQSQEEEVALHRHEPLPDRAEAVAGAEAQTPETATESGGEAQPDENTPQPEAPVAAGPEYPGEADMPAEQTPGDAFPVAEKESAPSPRDAGDTAIEDAAELKQAMDDINRGEKPVQAGQEVDAASRPEDV